MPANVETMFYAGQIPWHGMGVRVDREQTAAGLDWDVGLRKMLDAEDLEPVPGHYAVRRSDNQAVLGVVGRLYTPIQNRQAFDFCDALVGEGQACYHTAGSLGIGERIWMLVSLKETVAWPGDEEIPPFLLLTNQHDGRASLRVLITRIRVVCQNTLEDLIDIAALAMFKWMQCHRFPHNQERAKANERTRRRTDVPDDAG